MNLLTYWDRALQDTVRLVFKDKLSRRKFQLCLYSARYRERKRHRKGIEAAIDNGQLDHGAAAEMLAAPDMYDDLTTWTANGKDGAVLFIGKSRPLDHGLIVDGH